MTEFNYQKALVTGGAGFIGSHICEALVEQGVYVVSLDNYSAGKRENHASLDNRDNFTAVDCDITNVDELARHFEGVEIVFHNAASKKSVCLLDPRRDLQVNALGTFNVLELTRAFGVKKLVHASTGSVYIMGPEPIHEQHSIGPRSYYGVSKLAGEQYVQMMHETFGLNTTVLRYFHVYGPRQESNEFGGVVAIFIRNMLNGERPVIFGDGTQTRSFTWVKDVVRANLLVACDDRARGQIYNCASGISVTVQDLCDRVIELFGQADHVTPRYDEWTIGDAKQFDVRNDKLRGLGMRFDIEFFANLKEMVNEAQRPRKAEIGSV